MNNSIELDTIYVMDCVRGMKMMPDESVDLTVTSPPYNAGIDYGECYNDNKPLMEYLAFLRSVLMELYRITKRGGELLLMSLIQEENLTFH